ncbi:MULTISPECIES: ABC transporter permease [Nitrosomonas]|uniref:ABC transporter permease n=1 Tax=Nitrosomonas communis TaxID=44574 RepID=A0A0F7KK72_9PROT|nr:MULTISPECIES: ABC transporter permease [Nitrosomonas]AKH39488.1 ABC transporter permease [Nitrosomonas communis]TYP92381.1 ABC-2 type transport system permease protein [Nitrosomonas communis]UVS62793.1 ABC transporter permease [Nitrosomonas sp. PLL12]
MILTIASKELKLLFVSPLAWTFLALIQLMLTWVFLGQLDAFLELQSQLMQIANPPGATEVIIVPVFAVASLVLLVATPLLTMRLMAEEWRNHTMTLLISAPISLTAIVLGKFLGLMIFFLLAMLLAVMLSLSLLIGGAMDLGLLLSNMIGLSLLAACFISIGLYISSLTSHPAIAAVGTLGILLVLWIADVVATNTSSVIQNFSLLRHYESFNRGLIDSFSLAFLVLFILTFLILTIRRLDGKRLHG